MKKEYPPEIQEKIFYPPWTVNFEGIFYFTPEGEEKKFTDEELLEFFKGQFEER